MWVAVKIECLPLPVEDIDDVLRRSAGKLTCNKSTIKINIDIKGDRLFADLYFEMPDQAQYKVVDEIFKVIKMNAWEFYSDISVSFSRTEPWLA